MLLVGETDRRSSAVARPMPDEPPVMRVVLLVRVVRDALGIVKGSIIV